MEIKWNIETINMSLDNSSQFVDKFKKFCEINKLNNVGANVLTKSNLKEIFAYLGQSLLDPEHTVKVVQYFRCELLNILWNAIDFDEKLDSSSYSQHIKVCIALAKIIEIRPDATSFIIKYFQKYPAPFDQDGEILPSKKKFKPNENANFSFTDSDVVSSSHTLLLSCTDFFKSRWSWAIFISKYRNLKNEMAIWEYCDCIRIVTGMNELPFNNMLKKKLMDDAITKCIMNYESRETKVYDKIVDNCLESDVALDVSDSVVCVGGIYLPIHKKIDVVEDKINFLSVDSTKRNLRKVALGVVSNKAVCLQGPVGSGKTFLVEYMATMTGRILGESFIKVQLSDQTDSKMLLGTYRCTDIPGEFVWQPGVLTQAVMEGHWLLLEDIDLANMDIASVLTALLENRFLTVPGYRDSLPIAPGFQLFLTQRLISTITGLHKKQSNVVALLEKNVLQINIDPLTITELVSIIQTIYPKLTTIATRMVDTFDLFSTKESSKSGRLISSRDLFKWCARSEINYDVTSQYCALNVLQNAMDVFCCAYSSNEDRLQLSCEISSRLGIIDEKADYYLNRYKPEMSLSADSLTSSRISLQKVKFVANRRMKYCFTRPSACLLERVMCCVNMKEPALLVGETGTGKTLAVQYLAHILGVKLIVINMNQQSDSADLLGGFKPVDLKFVISPIKNEFVELFSSYFNVAQNQKFLNNISICFKDQKWNMLIKLMKKSYQSAINHLTSEKTEETGQKRKKKDSATPSKKEIAKAQFIERWSSIGIKLQKLEAQLKHKSSLAFSFIEGSLVKAVENGYWVLLDEINLANAETLECLSGLLEGNQGSICLLERGDKAPIKRHPQFTLFACMNPSTDVGKRDLPTGLRNRFTELYMDELTDRDDLIMLVNDYLTAMCLPSEKLQNIVNFYRTIKKEAQNRLCDGVGQKPHFSLRTLCRALTIAAKNPCGVFIRSLYEAFCLSFLTQLDNASYDFVKSLINKFILGIAKNAKGILEQPIAKPQVEMGSSEDYLEFEGYWVTVGQLEPSVPDDYILTNSVRRNLRDLVRVVAIGKANVLLQGDTSVGKTSLINYLAKSSGNKCVRINNHEHTDLQEYIGSYMADDQGKLAFREGLLVQAMRNGHWIILDELNLAPTDVLEALNRVLDDNRELFIPETQEIVKAHPNFMVFATQNPPGLYGGRKILSRAFRNRFVELHFNEIPPPELENILHMRCKLPPTYAKKMVAVMVDLQMRRKGSAAFAGKQGFITLRDLFRWGERYRLAGDTKSFYDWDQHIADEGYLLLAGRVRNVKEREEIADALKKHMRRDVLPQNLFTLSEKTSTVTRHILESFEKNKNSYKNIVWTFNMRQLGVLVGKSLEFNEPVLLVGETGGGKTTICKLLAEIHNQSLFTVNCHMHTESSDFIGGLRPVREHSNDDLNRLFEWVDGPLIKAMVQGDVFLADEISLADDSVLERLNSLLEPERSLLLAEKGSSDFDDSQLIVAHNSFHFVGTMNPGGDHGKKELSPALRNRFTEIWCESCTDTNDLIEIIETNIGSGISLGNQEDGHSGIGKSIMAFIEWFKMTSIGKRFTISIRDILTWVNFINTCVKIDIADAYLHGACLTFLDSFGSGVTSTENTSSLNTFKAKCMNFLNQQLTKLNLETKTLEIKNWNVKVSDTSFGIEPFYLTFGPRETESNNFTYKTPTCTFNTLRLLRALQLSKAILLEGSPGVGKTSLVSALAKSTHNHLLRINLSDQTDISDLFGADLPVEGGKGGQFAWRDGAFLQALKKGHWILLDELNLASQSVLEGLNACLDHRGEVFIPELSKTFYVKPGTRLFATQNPLKQGGSRRGLPQSFLNRFTQVYIDPLEEKDLLYILTSQFPSVPQSTIQVMVEFNTKVVNELDKHSFGHRGAPWEFNLRDLTRWCEAVINENVGSNKPENLVQLMYIDRMRTSVDKIKMQEIFEEVFSSKIAGDAPVAYVTKSKIYLGDVIVEREMSGVNLNVYKQEQGSLVLRTQLPTLRSLAYCVNFNWMAILVGSSGSGKSSVVRTLANLVGKTLHTLPVTSAMDTTDILGGFEQVDYTRHMEELIKETELIVLEIVQNSILDNNSSEGTRVLRTWERFSNLQTKELENATMHEETQYFIRKMQNLKNIWNLLRETSTKFSDQILNLEEKGEKVVKIVKEEDNLNAGGKFEWVDSKLIKCLQEGSWLLIENVNLCSPAVLDRLNALLEPNGVLTIGERGVNENGEMVEIKPHADFRLFLTMDPKNGEISRAMRNRGVEIYMLSETEQGVTNLLDLKSLISEAGLEDNNCIDVLLRMHNYLSDVILGEKPNINNLMQASFLISQELCRGRNVLSAFYDALVDVYYKTRSSNEFDCGFSFESIKDELKNSFSLIQSQKDTLQLYEPNVTLKTYELTKQSEMELIKQQSAYLRQAFMEHSKLLYSMVNFYTLSTRRDCRIRYIYSEKLLKTILDNKKLQEVNKQLCSTLVNCGKITDSEVSYDLHWLPDFAQTEETNNNANKIFLLLCFAYIKKLNAMKTSIKNNARLSLLEFFTGVKDKKVEPKLDDVLETHLLILLKKYDSFLKDSLSSEDVHVNDQDVVAILSLLKWRFILDDLLNKNIKEMNLQQYRTMLTNLHVHFKWFQKFAIKKLFEILKVEKYPFEKYLAKINSSNLHKLAILKRMSRQYQKLSEAPPPLINQTQIVTFSKYIDICEQLNVYNEKNDFSKLVKVLLQETDLRSKLIEFKTNLDYEFCDAPEGLDDFINITKKLRSDDVINVKNLYCVDLLPVFDYVARLGVLKMKSNINENKNHNMLAEILTVPVDLVGVLEQYKRTSDSRLVHEMKSNFFYYLLNSASVNPSKFTNFDVVEVGTKKDNMSQFAPLLSSLVTNLLVTDEESNTVLRFTNYGNYRDMMDQHRILNLLVWKNLRQICNGEYDFVRCETQYLLQDYSDFIHQVSKVLNLEEPSENVVELTTTCIHKIEEVYSSSAEGQIKKEDYAFIILLGKCVLELKKLYDLNNLDDSLRTISNVYILLNYLKITFNSKLPLIDPLLKVKFKKKYVGGEIEDFSAAIQCYRQQNDIFSASQKTLHSYVAIMNEKIEVLNAKLVELGKYIAVRPDDVIYASIVQTIMHHFEIVLHSNIILKSFSDFENQYDEIQKAIKTSTSIDLKKIEAFGRLCKQNVAGYEKLVTILKSHRHQYPDVIEPLLNSVVQFSYGFKIRTDLQNKILTKYQNMQHKIDLGVELVNIIKFPSLHDAQNNFISVIKSYTSEKLQNFIALNIQEQNVCKQENFRLLKCGLYELTNALLLVGQNYRKLDGALFKAFDSLLTIFIGAWKTQQEEMERKKKEDEQLYKIVPKSETQVLEEEFQDIFPNFHRTDFADMYITSLEDDVMEETPFKPSYVGVITQEDVRFVSAVHERLMALYTKSEWLNPQKIPVGYDFATPLIYKYKIFKCLLNKFGKQLDYSMDVELLNSLNVLIAVAQNFGDVSSLDKQIVDISKALKKDTYNFYKDSNVDEVKGSFHVLEELRIKIEEFLMEWPDHPGLKTIQLIINRIYGFDVTCPLSKFLTGFEILLTKCHDWEENAHSGVSLSQYIANLIQQIKTWRQLEMSMWKNSLNNAYDRMNEPLQKWWFYLHEIMTQFINETSKDGAENLISTLQKFFTESNLAEYSGRLNLLFTFHCHALHLQKSEKTDQFVNILWNVHEYFKQFLPNVEKKIKELRTPIEKKMKDYIKIIKWKDINYFAVMNAIDKTHKALHKHIKEFQDVLIQSATSCLVNITSESTKSVGIWDQPQEDSLKRYTVELDHYLAKQSLVKDLEIPDGEVIQTDDSILSKADKYFEKSKILCKKTMLATNYSTLIQSLDDLITCVIENSNRLQSLEVDQTLPVNKQKSQAKSFLQQKRKALSDLFKTLTEIGLSFHTGIMYSKIKQHSEQFLMKPIELNATLNHLNKTKSNEKLSQIWQGCETYYLKSLMRLDILESNLTNPSKDLGPQNVERCRGFSEHLMKTIMDQKTKLTETTRILYYLKYYSNCFTMHCRETSFISIEDHETIKEVLRNVLIVMEQYKIIVRTYPHESNFGHELHSIPTLHSENANSEENWTTGMTSINTIVNLTEKLISRIISCDQSLPRTDFQLAVPLCIPISNIDSVIEEMRLISSNLSSLISVFGTSKTTNSLLWLNSELVKVIDLVNKENVETITDTEDFKKHSENFLESTLLVVQNIYKKYKDVSPVVDDSEEEDLKENHLKTLLIESLFDDLSVLEMNKILKDLHALISKFYAFKSSVKSTTSKILPSLQQLILMYEYFVTQQVSAYRVTCKMNSVLLNVFIDLSTKGFCIPPEFSDELSSDEHGQNLSSGMGLGDGEGEKDVSDKIESEDQLEDAHPRDQEKEKEDDKDCKEEDNAIEMSEDFDSKLQDVEKGKDDDDEDQQKSDDDDADEQMGETEKGADQLDKEIWGSDNEEEEEEKEKPEEKGSKGEKQGENELAAKEKESKDEEKEDPSGKDNKLENEKEVNEMQEQDMDDDQVDPYHDNHPEYPEPEDLDLAEDLDVDDTKGQDEQEDETNPFDIDAMKENQEPDDKNDNDKNEEPSEENNKDNEDLDDSASDSESVGHANEEREKMEMDGEQEDSSKPDDEINDKEGTEKGEEDQHDDDGNNEQSGLDPTPKNEDNIQAMDVNNAESADNVQSNPSENQKPNQASEDTCQEDNPDKKGVGQSKMEESTSGHDGEASVQQDASSNQNEKENKMKRKPGESDSKRSLGDTTEPVKKKFKAMDIQEEEMDLDDNEDQQKQDADAYQHIKEAKSTDHQILDTASKEQADEQKEVPNFMEEEGEKANDLEDVVPEDEEEEAMDTNETVKQKAEKMESEKKKNSEKGHPEGEMLENLQDINVEGEIVQTLTAAQGETTHHTAYSNMSNAAVPQLTIQELNQLRSDVQQQLSVWNEVPNSSEAEQAWGKISSLTTSLAQNLSEQLRMVLEPTQASHLKGDFRTGRRINMRKIIPYIASQFRKDKIWLRRTKPSKREYKIALAIDDSASMSYNNSKELAFESIALISKALTLLESGQLSVLSFGENTEVLHKLTDTFTDKSGVKLMQKLSFNQTKTDVGNLVEFASEMLNSSPTSSNAAIAKLLILVGDGRGIFSEDKNQVLAAIRRAKLANIFMVFVIVDNPTNKHSILEQKKAIFNLDAKNKQTINLVSYMDQFPFPFYIILRDINTLPSVLSDALRQWFEIVTNSD